MDILAVLTFFSDNWYVITVAIFALILCIIKIVEFIGYPTKKKKEEIKNRLLYYVTAAELELGSGTGRLKLAQVYDYFCKVFPHTKKWFTIDKFSDLVDEVLPAMRDILENKEINQ